MGGEGRAARPHFPCAPEETKAGGSGIPIPTAGMLAVPRVAAASRGAGSRGVGGQPGTLPRCEVPSDVPIVAVPGSSLPVLAVPLLRSPSGRRMRSAVRLPPGTAGTRLVPALAPEAPPFA